MRYRDEGRLLVLVLLILIVFAVPVSAEEITIKVTDVQGNSIPQDITVEIQDVNGFVKEAIIQGCQPVLPFPNSITLDVPHTGSYKIIGKIERDFVKTDCDSYGCQLECGMGADEVFTDSEGIPYKCRLVSLNCNATGCNPIYEKAYHFVSGGVVYTHVKEGDFGEDDVARLFIETRDNKLWQNADVYGEVTKTAIEDWGQPYWVLPEEAAEGYIDKHVTSKIIKDSLRSNAGSILIVQAASTIIDPEREVKDLFTVETTAKITVEVGADYGVAYLMGEAGGPVAFMVAMYIKGKFYVFDEWKLCQYTEIDDLDIIVGAGEDAICGPPPPCEICPYPCTFICDVYPLKMFNYGNGVPSAWFVDKQCQAISANPSFFEIKGPYEMTSIYADWQRLTGTVVVFESQARLGYAPATIPGGSLCHKIKPLSDFVIYTPVITNINYNPIGYSGDIIEASCDVYDNKAIEDGSVFINRLYDGSEHDIILTRDPFSYKWRGNIIVPQKTADDPIELKIYATDTDGQTIINDNDQQMFKIKVVEDAGSGGDAPDNKENAINIDSYTSAGERLSGYILYTPWLNYYDKSDFYKFHVEAGQKIDISFSSDEFSVLSLDLDIEDSWTKSALSSKNGILTENIGLTASETCDACIKISVIDYHGMFPEYDKSHITQYNFSVRVYDEPYPVNPVNPGTNEKESITVPDVTLTAVGDKPAIPRKAIIKQIAGKEVNPDETLNIFEDDLGTINSPSCNLGDSKLLYLALDKTYLNYEPGMDPNNIIDPKPWSCRRELDENGQEVGYSCCYVPTDDDLVYGCEEHTLFAEIDAEGNEIGDLVIENYVDDIGVDWRYFVIYTTGNNELKITTAPTYYEGSANFLDLYVGCGYYPDEYDYDYASQGPDANEEIIISNPGWAFYYIGVSPNTDWGWYTINITLDGVEQPLQVNIDDWFNEFHDYLITTPPNAAAIKIETKDVEYRGTDFLDLYARYDNFASPDYYDFASKSASANELITIINPKSGNYYIGVDSKNDDWGLYGLSAKPGYKWWNCSYGNQDYSVFWVPASNLENNKDYHIFITSGYPYPPPNPTNKESKNITIHVTRDMAPEVGSINAEVRFNRVFISVTASDENNNLDYVDIYANGGQIASGDISGGTYTYEWDTSNLQDRDTYVANATVFDARGNWATTNDIAVEVRVDSEAPNISALVAVDTPQGVVVGDNVSGFLLLSLSVSDDKSGIDSINVSLKNTETTTEGGYTIQTESNPSETLTTRGLTNILSKFRDDGVKTFSQGGESEPTVDETGGLIYWNTTELNGEQTILVNATDNLGNTAVKEFTFNVDNTPPTINSVKPSDNAILEGIEDLEVNASDENVGVYDAEWFLNLTGKQLKIGSGTKTMWGSSGLDGSYTLTVNVSDVVGNMQSVDVHVTIRSPDLSINESEVVITDNNITAVIHNLGSADAQNVNVSFYSGNESFASEMINVSAGGSEVVVVNYTPTEKDITVAADPYDWITEIDEWNNYVVIEAQSSDFDHDKDGIVRGDLDDLRSQYNAYIGIIVGDESEYDHNGNGVVRGDLDDLRSQYNAYIGLGGV